MQVVSIPKRHYFTDSPQPFLSPSKPSHTLSPQLPNKCRRKQRKYTSVTSIASTSITDTIPTSSAMNVLNISSEELVACMDQNQSGKAGDHEGNSSDTRQPPHNSWCPQLTSSILSSILSFSSRRRIHLVSMGQSIIVASSFSWISTFCPWSCTASTSRVKDRHIP